MIAQAGLCRTWSETPKTGFLITRLKYFKLGLYANRYISYSTSIRNMSKNNHLIYNLIYNKHIFMHLFPRSKSLVLSCTSHFRSGKQNYVNLNKGSTCISFKYIDDFIDFFFFWIQFNVPFKIISLIETSQSIGGRNGSTPGKPPDTPASRTWLVSHVASAGLEPTPDTAVR